MRAAKLMEVQKIEVVEMEKPEIKKDNEVLVQVKAVGICVDDDYDNLGEQLLDYFELVQEYDGKNYLFW